MYHYTVHKYGNIRRVAAYTQVRECVHIIFTKRRERKSYSIICRNIIPHPALSHIVYDVRPMSNCHTYSTGEIIVTFIYAEKLKKNEVLINES